MRSSSSRLSAPSLETSSSRPDASAGLTALVLSGGGSLGAIQVGMLRALYQHDVAPDVLVATSVGAVNAAFVASRRQTVQTADELAQVWSQIRRAYEDGCDRLRSRTVEPDRLPPSLHADRLGPGARSHVVRHDA